MGKACGTKPRPLTMRDLKFRGGLGQRLGSGPAGRGSSMSYASGPLAHPSPSQRLGIGRKTWPTRPIPAPTGPPRVWRGPGAGRE